MDAGALNLSTPRPWFGYLLLWLVGIDLRVTLLAVPPVLPLIHRDLVLNEKAVGALTVLPVLLLGIAAIAGSLLIARIGARRAFIAGLLLVAVAGAGRGIGPSEFVLFAMTLLMGIGISVCQPAAPTIVGEWFPRSIGLATAVYVNGLVVGEALSASLTIPFVLPLIRGSWGWSFVVWSFPVVLTILLFLFFTPHIPQNREERPQWWPDWRDRRTWQLGFLLGGISVGYFGANTFIPDYFHATGRPALVGICLAVLNLSQLPSSFLTLFFAHWLAGRKEYFVLIGVFAMGGLAALMFGPQWLVILGAGILGFCPAVALMMIVALPAMLTDQADVHRLSAGMFTIGYTLSFLGSLFGGAVWDATHLPITAFLPVAIGALMMIGFGAGLRIPRPA